MLLLTNQKSSPDEALLSTAGVQQMHRAEAHQIQAVKEFVNASKSRLGEESAFLESETDLIAVNAPPEESVPVWVASIFMLCGLGCLIRSSVSLSATLS